MRRLAFEWLRAELAVLGCLEVDQQISWNLHLQISTQLKWLLSRTGSDGEETNTHDGRPGGEGSCQSDVFVSSPPPVPHPKAGFLHHSMPDRTFYQNRKSNLGQ